MGAPAAPAWGAPAAPGTTPGTWYGGWFYLSASGLATAIAVLAAVAAALFGIGAGLGLAGALEEDWETLDVSGGFIGFGYLANLVLGIVLIIWTRRITGNLQPLGAALELGTGWAVGSWFTPIVNYWFPLRIWNQAWRATTPGLPVPIGWAWKGLPAPALHWICWVGWHVGSVLAAVGVPTEDDTSTDIGYFGFIGGAILTASLALLVFVVRNLTQRQDAFARQHLPGLQVAGTPGGARSW